MIATIGDEAYALFPLFPQKALLLTLVIFVISILAVVFSKLNKEMKYEKNQDWNHNL